MTKTDKDICAWLQLLGERILGAKAGEIRVGPDFLNDSIMLTMERGPLQIQLYRSQELEDSLHEYDAAVRFHAIAETLERPSCDADEIHAFMRHRLEFFWAGINHARLKQHSEFVCDRHGGHASGQPFLRPNPTGVGQMRLCPACAEVHDTDPSKGLTGPGTLMMVEDSVDDLRREASAHLTYIQAALHAITGDADFLIGNTEPETLLSRLELVAGKLREIADKITLTSSTKGLRAKEPGERSPGPAGSRWS